MPIAVSERESQRQLMARKRSAEREIGPEVDRACRRVDLAKRAELEGDTPVWLATFFADIFRHPFTQEQLEWIEAIERCMTLGGDKAIAAPRGEGKTSIAERVILKAIITGKIRYAVLVASTGVHARRSLRNIKKAIEKNPMLLAWYPEVCAPVALMDRAPQRAKKQTCNGDFTEMQWEVDSIRLPLIQSSRCSGSMISCHGLDAAVRGLNEEGLRPDFILIDDPETRESAASDQQCETREEIIEKDLAGLGGPGEICGRLMLCTLQNRTPCLAAKYTDPMQKPWDGKRYRLLDKLPEREDLWEQYVELQKQDKAKAMEFYIASRDEMDRGAVVCNPNRYIGGQELSALQHCYNWIARIGWDNFRTEFQNDPPEETGPQLSGITFVLVQSRLHDYRQGIVPEGIHALTLGVDVSNHYLHWVAIAWKQPAIGFIVDYDEFHVIGTSPEDTEQLAAEKAVYRALVNLREHWNGNPFATDSGEIVEPKIVMIDSGSGLHTSAVYQFVRSVGFRPYVAAKGFAKGGGMTPFSLGNQQPGKRITGEKWFQQRQDKERDIWLHGFDADYWKRFVHQRFLTPTVDDHGDYRAGTLSLWRSQQSHRHTKFAKQIEAEVWTTDFQPGPKGEKEYWERRHRANHYLDACAMACAAGSMCGIRIIEPIKSERPRRSLADIAAAARNR